VLLAAREALRADRDSHPAPYHRAARRGHPGRHPGAMEQNPCCRAFVGTLKTEDLYAAVYLACPTCGTTIKDRIQTAARPSLAPRDAWHNAGAAISFVSLLSPPPPPSWASSRAAALHHRTLGKVRRRQRRLHTNSRAF
jgi:hypothetical protein